MICLNSLNIRSKIWRRFLNKLTVLKVCSWETRISDVVLLHSSLLLASRYVVSFDINDDLESKLPAHFDKLASQISKVWIIRFRILKERLLPLRRINILWTRKDVKIAEIYPSLGLTYQQKISKTVTEWTDLVISPRNILSALPI